MPQTKTAALATLTDAIERHRKLSKDYGVAPYTPLPTVNDKVIKLMNAELKPLLAAIDALDFRDSAQHTAIRHFIEVSTRCQKQCEVLGINYKEQIVQASAEAGEKIQIETEIAALVAQTAQDLKEIAALVADTAQDLLEFQITRQPDARTMTRHIEKQYTGNEKIKTQCAKLGLNPAELIKNAQAMNQEPDRAAIVTTGKEILQRTQNQKFASNPGYRQQTIMKLARFEKQCAVHNINVHEMGVGIRKHDELLTKADVQATAAAAAEKQATAEKQPAQPQKSSGLAWFRKHLTTKHASAKPAVAAKPKKPAVAHKSEVPKP